MTERLPISLGDCVRGGHAYDVYVETPELLRAAKGHEMIVYVYARTRTQAAAVAKREGYSVRSVNMVG